MIDRFNVWVGTLVGRLEELKNEDGQAMVEYALILALVSIAAIAVLGFLADDIKGVFNTIVTALPGGHA